MTAIQASDVRVAITRNTQVTIGSAIVIMAAVLGMALRAQAKVIEIETRIDHASIDRWTGTHMATFAYELRRVSGHEVPDPVAIKRMVGELYAEGE